VWTRILPYILLLCSVLALAQTVPDFSGVFLRNPIERNVRSPLAEDPLILTIKQAVDTLQITEMQNGTQATNVYNLNRKASVNVSPDGVQSKDRIKSKGGKLLIKSCYGLGLPPRCGLGFSVGRLEKSLTLNVG